MSSSNSVEVESDPYQVAQTIALMALGRRAKSRGELSNLAVLKKRLQTQFSFAWPSKALSMIMSLLAIGVNHGREPRRSQSE